MATYFLDSSALVKRYAIETGTAWVRSLFDPAAGNQIYLARITGVEATAALARKRRGNLLTQAEATAALAALRRELVNLFILIEISPALLGEAETLAERHALRGYDAVQLAAALEANSDRIAQRLAPLTLVAADRELLTAAAAEGLRTDDPENH